MVLDRLWLEDLDPERQRSVRLRARGTSKIPSDLHVSWLMLFPLGGQEQDGDEESRVPDYGACVWSPDGGRLWSIARDDRSVYAWEGDDLVQAAAFHHSLGDSLTGRGMVSALGAGKHWIVCGCANGNLAILDGAGKGTLTPASYERGPGGAVSAVAVHPSENWAVVGTESGRLQMRALPSCQVLADLPPTEGAYGSVCLSHDGHWLVTGDVNGQIRMYEVLGSAPQIRMVPWVKLQSRSGPVRTVRISRDRRWLIGTVQDGRACLVWDLAALCAKVSELQRAAVVGRAAVGTHADHAGRHGG